MKKWRTHKKPSWFANKKFYSLLHFLVAVERRETHMKTESTALARQRETKCHEEKESRDRLWIFFHVFYCSSNTCFLIGSVLPGSHQGGRPFFGSHSKMEVVTFSCLHIVVWCPTNCLYLVVSGRQLTLSCFFFSRADCSYGVFVWVPASQSEHIVDLLPIRLYL